MLRMGSARVVIHTTSLILVIDRETFSTATALQLTMSRKPSDPFFCVTVEQDLLPRGPLSMILNKGVPQGSVLGHVSSRLHNK